MKQRKNTDETWADILRESIRKSGKTHYRLHLETDKTISQTQLARFMAGTHGLSLQSAERLAKVLGVKLVAT
jgi:hypothetical protein